MLGKTENVRLMVPSKWNAGAIAWKTGRLSRKKTVTAGLNGRKMETY
jgi:hypothetical protein